MLTTRDIQKRLIDLGYNPGVVDGVRGRQTIAAIREYQTNQGLLADGIVGPVTRSKLFGTSPGLLVMTTGAPLGAEPDLPWYEEARRLLGVREVSGGGSNRQILDWAKDLDVAYSGDDVPWCGLFVGHCIGSTLPDENLPASLLSARSWLKFGRPCAPTKGCILVFWRGEPQGSKGHVGFYAGEDEECFYVLGGNQSDRVSIARVAKARLLDTRFPTTAVFGERRTVLLTPGSDPFSTDEA